MDIHGTITTLEEFNELVQHIRERRIPLGLYGLPLRWEFYRGQTEMTWNVVPGVARKLKTDNEVKEADIAIIEHFKKRVTEENQLNAIFLHDQPNGHQNDWAWYMQAQHYRVPTRLLDWTGEPHVALYFAVENGANDGVDGAFFVYYSPHSKLKIEGGGGPQFYDLPPVGMTGSWFMNPAFELAEGMDGWIGEARRARQHGKFSLQDYSLCRTGLDLQPEYTRGYDETIEMDVPVIEKYIIPAAYKAQLRVDMIVQGWHGEWLYKDEIPIINTIRDECAQLLAARVAASEH